MAPVSPIGQWETKINRRNKRLSLPEEARHLFKTNRAEIGLDTKGEIMVWPSKSPIGLLYAESVEINPADASFEFPDFFIELVGRGKLVTLEGRGRYMRIVPTGNKQKSARRRGIDRMAIVFLTQDAVILALLVIIFILLDHMRFG